RSADAAHRCRGRSANEDHRLLLPYPLLIHIEERLLSVLVVVSRDQRRSPEIPSENVLPLLGDADCKVVARIEDVVAEELPATTVERTRAALQLHNYGVRAHDVVLNTIVVLQDLDL